MKAIITLSAWCIIAGMISCTPSVSTSTRNLYSSGTMSSGNAYSNDAATSQQNSLGNTTMKRRGSSPTDDSKLYSNQPPVTVAEGFKKKYPNYTPGDWTFQEGQYTTVYMNEGKSYQASFSSAGEWLTTQSDVVRDDLPASVKQTFQSSPYGSASSPHFTQIETSQYPVLYKVDGHFNNESFTMYITPTGEVVTQPQGLDKER